MIKRSMQEEDITLVNIYAFNIGPPKYITLPTKVHIVKVMVFPVVIYGCESWTIKKFEYQRIDAL